VYFGYGSTEVKRPCQIVPSDLRIILRAVTDAENRYASNPYKLKLPALFKIRNCDRAEYSYLQWSSIVMMPVINFDHKALPKHSSFYSRRTNSMPYIAYGLVFVLLLLVNIEAFAQLSGVPGATVSETIQPINGTAPITISAQLGTVSPSSIGTSGPVTGASATYSYTIPANAQVGSIITDTVTIQSFPSTSFPTTLTISTTVLPPPTTNTTTPTTPTTPTQSNLTNTPLQAPCAALQTRQQAGQSLSPGQTDLLSTCSTVSSLPSSQAGGAIQQLTPVQVTAQSTLALTASNQQFRNVFSRLSLLRHGAKGVDVSGLNVRSNGQVLPAAFSNALVPGHTTGGGASSDKESPFDKFGVFVNVVGKEVEGKL